MNKKLFGKDISPACAYCKFGTKAKDETIVCPKKGIVSPFSNCKKYKYDALKRQPKSIIPADDFSAEDFSL